MIRYPIAIMNPKEMRHPYAGCLPGANAMWEWPFMVNASGGYDYGASVLINDNGEGGLPWLMVTEYRSNIHLIDSQLRLDLYKKNFTCHKRHFNPSAMRVLRDQEFDIILLPGRTLSMNENATASLLRLSYNLLAEGGSVIMTERLAPKPGFDFIDLYETVKCIDKYTDFRFAPLHNEHIVDARAMAEEQDDLEFFWPVVQKRLDFLGDNEYTSCGWILRK